MKKFFCLCLCFLLILPSLTAFAGIAFSGALEVPYDVTYELMVHSSFKIDNMRDLERLLYFVDTLHLEVITLWPAENIYDNSLQKINEFLDSKSNEAQIYKPDQYTTSDDHFTFKLHWHDQNTLPHKILPKISSTEQLYNEVLKCYSHKNWRKVYVLDSDYASSIDIRNSDMDNATEEIFTKYGIDVSEKIEYFGVYESVFYPAIGAYVLGIENRHFRDIDIEENTLRYNRILKNNTILPITDDMTDAEKLRIIVKSTGNIYNGYHITGIASDNYRYSVGVGQCAHYARVFKKLCNLYGIECEVEGGTLSGEEHAWNIVKYDGKWYYTDTTGTKVENREISSDNMFLSLCTASTFRKRGYYWISRNPDLPFASENIYIESEEYTLSTDDFPETVEMYQMFEPYRAYNPMTIGPMIRYNIYFEKETGKIWAIDTNIDSDTFVKDSTGNIYVKDSTLEIPSEIDGVPVKIIGSNLNSYFKINIFDNMIIPSDVKLEHHAFYGIGNYNTTNVTIGDRVDIGIGAMPEFLTLDLGDDYIFRGFDSFASYENDKKYDFSEVYNGVILYHCDDEVLEVPEGYSHALFGCGNNIYDYAPTKTLLINKDVKYVDPRLNRLNRIFKVDEDNPYYTSENGILYSKDKTVLISVPVGVNNIEIPDTVEEIGEYAFAYCNEIENIIIPASVEKVGYRTFWHLSNIKNIYIEGAKPENFKVTLSGNPKILYAENGDSIILNHTQNGDYINITEKDATMPMVVFYDVYDKLLAIEKGYNIKIPTFAKSYKIYCWNNNLEPVSVTENGNF